MTGEQILNEVRYLIDDQSYSRYTEINRAFRRICRSTRFNWLRRSIENPFNITANQTEYYLDMSNMRVLDRFWIYGVDASKQYWHYVEEVPPQLFESKVREFRDSTGNDDTARPRYFMIQGSGSQEAKLTVTPTPDRSYSVKIDYTIFIPEIGRDTIPEIPVAYHDILAQLAAGYILESSKEPERSIYGQRLISRIGNDIEDLVRDSHPSRIQNIERSPQTWLR